MPNPKTTTKTAPNTPDSMDASEMDTADLVNTAASVDTLNGLREFLNRLHKAWNDDPEAAHGLEDQIKSRALQLAAEGHPDAALIAREVLVVDTWDDVDRWYA